MRDRRSEVGSGSQGWNIDQTQITDYVRDPSVAAAGDSSDSHDSWFRPVFVSFCVLRGPSCRSPLFAQPPEKPMAKRRNPMSILSPSCLRSVSVLSRSCVRPVFVMPRKTPRRPANSSCYRSRDIFPSPVEDSRQAAKTQSMKRRHKDGWQKNAETLRVFVHISVNHYFCQLPYSCRFLCEEPLRGCPSPSRENRSSLHTR
jgi:hypothetical protein